MAVDKTMYSIVSYTIRYYIDILYYKIKGDIKAKNLPEIEMDLPQWQKGQAYQEKQY